MDKEMITTLVLAIFASSGFWAFLLGIVGKAIDRKSAKNQMILGLGHDRIICLCEKYLAQGWVYSDDFENLHDYLYIPYKKMKGNGTAEKLMHDVEKLPIKRKTTRS